MWKDHKISENIWIYLNISEYIWIYLKTSGNIWTNLKKCKIMHKSLDSDIDNSLNSNIIKFKIIQQNSKKSEISHWLSWTWTLICSQRLMSNDLVIWNFSNLSGYIQIFPDLFRLFQIYSDLFRYFAIYSDKSR